MLQSSSGQKWSIESNHQKGFSNFKVGIIELSFPFMQEPTEKQLTLNKSSYSLAGIADDGGQSRVSCVVGNSKAIQTNGDNSHQLFNKKRPNLTSSTNCNPVNTDSRNCCAGLCTNWWQCSRWWWGYLGDLVSSLQSTAGVPMRVDKHTIATPTHQLQTTSQLTPGKEHPIHMPGGCCHGDNR